MKFIIKKSINNQFYFDIVANNGQILATSETYTRKYNAKKAIESIRINIFDAPIMEETEKPLKKISLTGMTNNTTINNMIDKHLYQTTS
jgi:uncharacterized protein